VGQCRPSPPDRPVSLPHCGTAEGVAYIESPVLAGVGPSQQVGAPCDWTGCLPAAPRDVTKDPLRLSPDVLSSMARVHRVREM